ncbi:MAG TPA: hypothetical protein ENJ46_03525 [Hellea balneolensis]|uniref:Lipoprotein n=1 Tax=Hellea balneolensis TaxID=287478 RepID=A0A7C3FZX9_9PROT|nr:hypothetical protein [Hellea balneolensis]
MKNLHFTWIGIFAAVFLQGCITAKDEAPYALQSCQDLRDYARANPHAMGFSPAHSMSQYPGDYDQYKMNKQDAILSQTDDKRHKADIIVRRVYLDKCKN